ncbi:MAG: ABC transporter permease [Gemmataceae bacterium]
MSDKPALDYSNEESVLLEPEPPLPRVDFNLSGLVTLYVLTLRQFVRGKRWWIFALLFLLPAGLAVLLRATTDDLPLRGMEFILVFSLIPLGLVPLISLLYASGIVQDELEEQTITYLLIRPLPKWGIYLGKLLATLTTTALLVAICTSFTFIGIYAFANPPEGESIIVRCLKVDGLMALAAVAYSCLFALISLFTRRSLIAGICYTIILEGILGRLPFATRLLTVAYYFRVIAARTLDFTITEGRHRVSPIGHAWNIDIEKDPSLLEHPQLATCFEVLVGASIVAALIAAFLFTVKEFRVKTPEGS